MDPGGQDVSAGFYGGKLPDVQFIGRDRELVEIERLLDDPTLDVVLLLGEAGVGKSRLARDVEHRWRRRVVPDTGGPPARSLVVIDDAHRLGLAERERLIEDVGVTGEGVVLVTDRRSRADAGTRQYCVGPLEVPDDYTALDLDAFCRVPSVELFVAVRRLSQPSFAVDATSQGSIARLCAYLRGVPLHLQLASRLLTDVDANLVGSPGTARSASLIALLERDITDEAVVQYDMLSTGERRVLGMATVFVGGFGQEALQEITGIGCPDLAGLVDGLLARSLLVRSSRTSAGVNGLVGTRCHLPITALPIARMILAEGGDASYPMADLHTEYYLGVLGRALDAMDGRDQQLGMTLLRVEWGNVDAALARLRAGPEPRRAVEAVRSLRRYWRALGLVFDAREQLEALTEREGALDRSGRRRLNLALADAEALLGEPEMAAESLRRATDDSGGVTLGETAEAEATRAQLELVSDDPRGAERMRRAGASLRAAGLAADADVAVLVLAMHTMLIGRPRDAAELCDSVLAAARRRGDHLTSAAALLRLCVCHAALDDLDRATEYYARGLGHLRPLGFAVALGQLAQVVGSSMVHDITVRAVNVTELLGAMSHEHDEMSAGPEEPIFIVGIHQEHMRHVLGLAAFTAAMRRGQSQTPFELLTRFAERVRSGMHYASPLLIRDETLPVDADPAYDTDAWHGLTPREAAVAVLVAEGLSNKQVAHRLSISDWTVVNHMRAVLRKLDCPSRVHVARWMAENRPTAAGTIE